MTRFTRPRTIFFGLLLLAVALAVYNLFWEPTDGRSPQEHRRIAEACVGLLRSTMTNEVDIAAEDPRLPEILRSLRPTQIQVETSEVVILRNSKPTEYHLVPGPKGSRTWVLYAAGLGYVGHRELIRIEDY